MLVVCLGLYLNFLLSNQADVRGVCKKDLTKYSKDGGVFECRDKSMYIPVNFLNDNHCDCGDDSDEPGTSACAHGTFCCENKGYVSKVISSMYVDDGVCDCCDGSDESDKSLCQNVCKNLYEKEFGEFNKTLKVALEGKKLGEDIASTVNFDPKMYESEKKSLEERIAVVKIKITELAEKNSELDIILKAKKQQQEASTSEDELIKELFEVFDTNKDKFVSKVEMKKLAAFLDFSERLEEKKFHKILKEQKFLDSLKSNDLNQFGKNKEVIEIVSRYYPNIDKECDKAQKDVTTSSNALKSEENLLEDLEEELKTLYTVHNEDFGPNRVFAPLVNKCFQFVDKNKYDYELCPFVKAKKAEFAYLMKLGKWKGWGSGENKYDTMIYETQGGCEGNHVMHTKVTLSCGVETKLTSAFSHNRCVHEMHLVSSAKCVVDKEPQFDQKRYNQEL